MKSLVVALAFIVLCAAEVPTCDLYNCSETLKEDECAFITTVDSSTIFELKPCKSPKVCDLHFGAEPDHCTETFTSPFRFPGETCHNDTDCFSQHCVKSVCSGLSEGADCSGDYECDVRHFCNSTNQCAPVKKEGETCSAYEKCDAHLVCNHGNCTRIGSLEEGTSATAPAACKSYYIFDNTCIKGPKLNRSKEDPEGPIKCPGKCVYKLEGKEDIEEGCACGRTAEGTSYCNPGKGDVDITDYLNYVNEMADSKEGCHVSRGVLCLYKPFQDMSDSYYKALISYNKLTRWAMFKDNPVCVKKMLNSEYWDAVDALEAEEEDDDKFGLYLFLGVAIGAVVVIAILLLVIYLKKSGSDDDENTTDEPLKVTA